MRTSRTYWLQFLYGTALGLTSSLAAAADPARVEWSPDWPRFRATEAVLTGTLTAQALTALLLYPVPERLWRGGILFDDTMRDGLRMSDHDDREAVRVFSDVIYYALAVYPFIVDTALVTWGIHGSGDVALEMLAMNAESYALTGALTLTAQKLGRERPTARGCNEDSNYSAKCNDAQILSESFYSGHTAVAFTSAGLICAHHQHLPLYGGGAPDVAACLAGMTAAAAEGIARIATDDHYSSDVLLGAFVGLVSGYVLPSWLHYGFGGNAANARSWPPSFRSHAGGAPFGVVLAPEFSANYGGVSLVGVY